MLSLNLFKQKLKTYFSADVSVHVLLSSQSLQRVETSVEQFDIGWFHVLDLCTWLVQNVYVFKLSFILTFSVLNNFFSVFPGRNVQVLVNGIWVHKRHPLFHCHWWPLCPLYFEVHRSMAGPLGWTTSSTETINPFWPSAQHCSIA